MYISQGLKLGGGVLIRIILLLPICVIWGGEWLACKYLDFSEWVTDLVNKYW